jgi:ribosomal-protein-alanine N-acetyltransferase
LAAVAHRGPDDRTAEIRSSEQAFLPDSGVPCVPARTRRFSRVRLPIQTARLQLIRPDPERVDEYVLLLNNQRVSRWLARPPFPYRRSDAQAFLQAAPARFREESGLGLSILHAESDRLIGGVGLNNIDWTHAHAEVGYWLGEPYWGQGYATEALRALLRVGFDALALHRVQAFVFVGNHRSDRVLRKLGFRLEGTVHHGLWRGDRWRNERSFALTADRLPGWLSSA